MGRLRPIRAGGGRRPGPLAAGSCGRAGALCLVSLSAGFLLLLGGWWEEPVPPPSFLRACQLRFILSWRPSAAACGCAPRGGNCCEEVCFTACGAPGVPAACSVLCWAVLRCYRGAPNFVLPPFSHRGGCALYYASGSAWLPRIYAAVEVAVWMWRLRNTSYPGRVNS